MGAFLVDGSGPGCDLRAAELAHHLQDLVIAVQRVGKIHRRVGELRGLGVVVFTQARHLFQPEGLQVKTDIGVIEVEILSHRALLHAAVVGFHDSVSKPWVTPGPCRL